MALWGGRGKTCLIFFLAPLTNEKDDFLAVSKQGSIM